jgi:hydroxymethylbilane synthase
MSNSRRSIRIGTRDSKLALSQTRMVIEHLKNAFSDMEVEIVRVKTEGDRDRKSRLASMAGAGIFTKSLEKALSGNRIEAAVHSAKDLPSTLERGFTIAAVLQRGPCKDVIISRGGHTLDTLPKGSRIGSGSPRRRAQILRYREDLVFEDIRGNIETRLRKLDSGMYDALILAEAAPVRSGISGDNFHPIPIDICLPAPGQGIICIETMNENVDINRIFRSVNHDPTLRELTAERSFLQSMGLGCGLPVAALAIEQDNKLVITGRVLDGAGQRFREEKITGDPDDAYSLGRQLGRRLLPYADEYLR